MWLQSVFVVLTPTLYFYTCFCLLCVCACVCVFRALPVLTHPASLKKYSECVRTRLSRSVCVFQSGSLSHTHTFTHSLFWTFQPSACLNKTLSVKSDPEWISCLSGCKSDKIDGRAEQRPLLEVESFHSQRFVFQPADDTLLFVFLATF